LDECDRRARSAAGARGAALIRSRRARLSLRRKTSQDRVLDRASRADPAPAGFSRSTGRYAASGSSGRRFHDAINTGDAEIISKTIDEVVEPDVLIRTRVAYDEIFIFRFVNGPIAEAWGVVDVLAQMRQLGVVST
jgi:hypothetical protein